MMRRGCLFLFIPTGIACVTLCVLFIECGSFPLPFSRPGPHGPHAVRVPKTEGAPSGADAVGVLTPMSRSRATPLILIVNIEKAPDDTKAAVAVHSAVSRWGDTACTILHYRECSQKTLSELMPRAIILGGQKTPWWQYSAAELRGVQDLLRNAEVPVLGICGGHQLLALTFGGRVAPIRRTSRADSGGYDGCFRERGWLGIQLTRDDTLLVGIPKRTVVWLNHCEEVKALPPHFIGLAKNGTCPVQAMKREDAMVYGVQFHPELDSQKNKSARLVLRNFLRIAGLPAKG